MNLPDIFERYLHGPLWNRLREREGRAKYRDLLEASVCHPQPTLRETIRKLTEKKIQRRKLPADHKQIRVLGFGTNDDWRRNGIWAAFRRLTDFHLFEVPDGRYLDCRDDESERSAKERDVLRLIDEQERHAPINVAFFSHSGRHISDALLWELQRRGIWSIVMSVDDKHQFLAPKDRNGNPHQLRVAVKADLYWTNWPLAVRLVNALGGNGWFAPPAADPHAYKPIPCEKDLDIVFVGARYGCRSEIVTQLGRFFKVASFGQGWRHGPVSFDESIKLYSRAKIVLGVSGVGYSIAIQTLKGRDFEVPMCGATYLTSANPEIDRCFEIGQEIICWSSIESCIECAADLLVENEFREKIGRYARQRCIKDHTWDRRLRDVLTLWNDTFTSC